MGEKESISKKLNKITRFKIAKCLIELCIDSKNEIKEEDIKFLDVKQGLLEYTFEYKGKKYFVGEKAENIKDDCFNFKIHYDTKKTKKFIKNGIDILVNEDENGTKFSYDKGSKEKYIYYDKTTSEEIWKFKNSTFDTNIMVYKYKKIDKKQFIENSSDKKVNDECGKEKNYALETMANGVIYFSNSEELNDLFDINNKLWKISYLISNNENKLYNEILTVLSGLENDNINDKEFTDLIKLVIDKINTSDLKDKDKYIEKLKDIDETDLKSKFRVLCLTTKPDNILMWSHYADNEGICLEYNLSKILEKLRGKVKFYIENIDYDNDRPTLKRITKLNYFYDEDVSDDLFNLSMLNTKFKDWKYENEIRIAVLPTESGFEKIYLKPESTIFGPKLEKKYKDNIIKACNKMDNEYRCEVFKETKLDDENFKLNIYDFKK